MSSDQLFDTIGGYLCGDAADRAVRGHAGPAAGYREMQRVARRVVTFHFDTGRLDGDFWPTRDYLPEHAQLSAGRPTLTERASAIGARLEPVPIPWDCCDGNFPSYWRRPEAYLDERVRRPVSVWHAVGPAVEQRVVRDLRSQPERP